LKQRDERLVGLEGSLKQRDERIGGLEDSLKQRDECIAGLEGSLRQRDERIGGLERSVEERDERIREMAQAHRLRDERIEGLVASLGQRDERLQEAAATLATRDEQIQQAETRIAGLEAQARDLAATRDRLTAERNALQSSLERKVGDILLNRLRLKPLVLALASLAASWGQGLVNWRLRLDRMLRPRRRRVVTTICWNFPIHSQTFVYQELTHLMGHGFDVRLVYSKIEPRDQLPGRYQHLWPARRRLYQKRRIHERNYEHYRRKMPDRVEALIDRVSEASGLPRDHVAAHDNFLEAFTFTRMVEAYRPEYLHSYFFYDRSFMALVAGYLLGIPRGVSCYADHVMKDYEFKLVPLHMELCDVVIATSARIKRELLELAPGADPSKILVKPNGIDPARFPVVERPEPRNGDPYRLVSVCRIEPKKGLLDLVDAVHLLKQRGVHVEAHIVGTADEWSPASVQYKQGLDERISELGLWGTVHLEGRQDLDGVLRFHHLAHLFVAPFVETETGDKDGIPTALLEGMAGGLPAVATDAGSITEVVEHGHDGYVVPQRQPEALADAIEALLSDPGKRSDLARNAAATVRNRFDADTLERTFHERVDALLRS
jgi:glycosyltransferase involved in cell wall biosynthesis